ncbi:MAG: Holliday junction branch migration protein RuvA [Anaerolineaceae bacterium]
MIASIQGDIIGKGEDYLTVALGGLGIRVFVPSTLASEKRISDHVFLHTHFVVREESLTLFGFQTEEEKEFFELLLGVQGVGPRIALAALSTLSVDAIRRAVFNEQSEVFSRIPGVGSKTAKKILLHLQGKVGGDLSSGPMVGFMDVDSEVIDALTSLGYSIVEAQAAIQSLPKDAPKDLENRLRMALQYYSN